MDGWTDGTSACSVPVDLDWREGPEVGVAHVEQGAAGGLAPPEGRHVIPGRAADRHQPKGGDHARGGDLQMGTQTGQQVSTGDGLQSLGQLLGEQPKEEPLQGCLAHTPSCRCRRGSAGAAQGRGRCRWEG